MKNLKSKSKENLLSELKHLVQNERKLISEVLDYLKEVEFRKLYLNLGYPSLFEFCIKELGYSEPSAQRRISAMRLIKDLPEIKTKLVEGSLNLTSLNQVSLFLNQEKRLAQKSYSISEKKEILAKLENLSKRECEKELIKISPQSATKRDFERIVAEDKIEVKFIMSIILKNKLEKVKSLISHKNPNPSYEELFTELAEMALKKLDPRLKKLRLDSNKSESAASIPEHYPTLPSPAKVENSSRYIPAKVKQFIWNRDLGKCQYRDTKTQKQCGATHFIQIDHIKPFSWGGSSTDTHNLRLLCGQHNRLRNFL